MFQTEYEFTLPMGFVDSDGTLHREGVMRLATAGDEIGPLRDERVQKNPAYLTVILLSRVVTKLGDVEPITPATIEGLFAADLEHLQRFYNEINRVGDGARAAVCPQCNHEFELERDASGGSLATPSMN
jgi:hypothetical protein